jgi:hypothetical protein
LRFVIKAVHYFEVRKSIGYCGSSYSRISEQGNLKWLVYKMKYLREAKGFEKVDLVGNKSKVISTQGKQGFMEILM